MEAEALGAGRLTRGARRLLNQAMRAAHQGNLDAAYLLAKQSTTLQPRNFTLLTARDALQQKAVLAHLQRAYKLEQNNHLLEAGIEFRSALAIDPQNHAAQQGLAALAQKMVGPIASPRLTATQLRVRGAAAPMEPQPTPGRHDFHLLGSTRQVLGAVASAYGLRAWVQNDLQDRRVAFDLTDADFGQAMRALRATLQVQWIAIDPNTLYFGPLSQNAGFRQLGVRTYYLNWLSDPKELTELAQVLRTILGLTHVQPDAASRSITVRATPEMLDATERLLLNFRHATGDVMLDVRILEVTRSTATKLGVNWPTSFQLFTLAPLLRALSQQSPDLQQQILQLFQQGGLNAVLQSGQLSSLLSQAGGGLSPLLSTPFVVFGGGATLMALTVPGLSANFSHNESTGNTIEDAWLRASNNEAATLKIGSRYPVINASFSPISLNPAISKVIGNGSYLQPFPSFTYEDLGLDLKLTPHIDGTRNIHLKVQARVRALTGSATNGVPIFSNRELLTEIGLRNGESAVLAGLFDQEETRSLSGLPVFGQIPGLGQLFSTLSNGRTGDQLLIVITPHVLTDNTPKSVEIWLPPGAEQPARR